MENDPTFSDSGLGATSNMSDPDATQLAKALIDSANASYKSSRFPVND
jgi:hypothetical protein